MAANLHPLPPPLDKCSETMLPYTIAFLSSCFDIISFIFIFDFEM